MDTQEEVNDLHPLFELVEVEGNLFSSPDALCHCVSEDFSMSAGIATVFKQKFGRVDQLKSQGTRSGGVAVLEDDAMDATVERDSGNDGDNVQSDQYNGRRFIYYLVTKQRYFHKPTYQSLESSLVEMKKHMTFHQVYRLSMPLIGCGLDGLKWDMVTEMIKRVFGDLSLKITVYKLPANSTIPLSQRGRGRGRGKARGNRGSNRGGGGKPYNKK